MYILKTGIVFFPAKVKYLNVHFDQLGCAVCTRGTDKTKLADLQQMVVEEWDVISQQCVTRLVTSVKRRCQAFLDQFGSSFS
uniref:Uncharacterized protein n=1 Tax=Oryzias melastigma TaxID=30732 RepID=A0A3B3C4G8_ORYME